MKKICLLTALLLLVNQAGYAGTYYTLQGSNGIYSNSPIRFSTSPRIIRKTSTTAADSELMNAFLAGAGLALIFLTGATTGGADIIAMLIRLRRPDVSMGNIMLMGDLLVIGLSYAVYREIESIMYAVIVIFICAKAIDFVLYGREHTKLIFIITAHKSSVLSAILTEVGRGASVLPVTGGYTGEEKNLILCAAKKIQIRDILRLTNEKDPKAFTIVCDAGQVIGEGFR